MIRLLEEPALIHQELDRRLEAARTSDPTAKREQSLQRELTHVGKGIERLLTAYQEGLPLSLEQLRERMPCTASSPNRHSVLSCRRSLTAPMIAPHSCAWQRLSQHSLLACAVRRKRLVSLNARKSYDSWLKTFWSARIPSPFVTASQFLQVRPKTEDPTTQTVKITFCVSGVVSPLLSNLYLNEVDRMLEKAIQTTRREPYTHVQYARFADDMVILIDSHPQHVWLARAVDKRLREELVKLKVEINEEKSKIVDVANGGSFTFLGFEYRRILGRKTSEVAHRTTRRS